MKMSKWIIFSPFPPLSRELDERNGNGLMGTQTFHKLEEVRESEWMVPESLYPISVTPPRKTSASCMTNLSRSTRSRWKMMDKLGMNNGEERMEGTWEMSVEREGRTQKFDLLDDVSLVREEEKDSQMYGSLVGWHDSGGCGESNPFMVIERGVIERKEQVSLFSPFPCMSQRKDGCSVQVPPNTIDILPTLFVTPM